MSTLSNLFSIKHTDGRFVITFCSIKLKLKHNYIGYNICGSGNKIIVVENGNERLLPWYRKIHGLDINIVGNNNIIKVACNKFENSKLKILANNTRIEFEKNTRLIQSLSVNVCCGNNQYLRWGENTSVYDASIFLHEENAGLIVGKECMFSAGIVIWATDGHAIIENSNRDVLNSIKTPVIIGDNCWIGHGVYLLKNTKLSNGTIVGSRSVVTRGYDENDIVLAGNPAKIVKKNVSWNRKTAYSFSHR